MIARADPSLALSSLAASAVALGAALDDPDTKASEKAMCAGQLRDTMARLRELMPKAAEKDGLDDLHARRASRLAGRSGP